MVLKKDLQKRNKKATAFIERMYDQITDYEFKVLPSFMAKFKEDLNSILGLLNGADFPDSICDDCKFQRKKCCFKGKKCADVYTHCEEFAAIGLEMDSLFG